MSFSDFVSVFHWWAVLFLIGAAFLPLVFRLFPVFFDRGYIFAKSLGLAVVSYLIFVTGVLHVIPFGQVTSFLLLMLCAGIFYLWRPGYKSILPVLKETWKVVLGEEVIFFLALFFWSYIRSYSPDIHGLEKYMDFGFVNSILRAQYFPPKDMWFTPFPINYYYFGHFMTAVLTKLSGIPSYITYNLMLSTIFALCFSGCFSLGANLYHLVDEKASTNRFKNFLAGLVGAVLVTLAGNLHILYAFFTPYAADNPVPLWKLAFTPFTFPNSYWYPNATRFIYNTIHEFPIYSWVVADLHGHVTDIPFVLLTLALLLSLLITHTTNRTHERRFPLYPVFIFLLSFPLAIMYMTNAWDGLIYLLLTSLVLLYLEWQRTLHERPSHTISHPLLRLVPQIHDTLQENKWLNWLGGTFVYIVLVGIGFFLFTLPFNIFFQAGSIAHGVGVLCAPEFLTKIGKIGPLLFEPEHCQKSPWWQMLTLYGFFLFFIVSFFIFLKKVQKLTFTDIFVLLLISLSLLLIIIPEFVYVKDIYPAHYRANTMFKLVFQAFILLSLSSGYILMRILTSIKAFGTKKAATIGYVLFFLPAVLLCGLVLTYPFLAIPAYYGNMATPQGLNGITYLQKQYPTDFDAITWLNTQVTGQPVILEAQGDSYTDFARVSANTGLPTVLGWTVHEWLWRGTYDIPAPRINEVSSLYLSPDLNQTKELIKKYNITYVFIGDLERQKYPALTLDKWDTLGKVVFEKGLTKIYKLNL